MTEFNGLKHYPLGDAALTVQADNLIVSNISPNGFDGVGIDTELNTTWDLQLASGLNLSQGKTINVRFYGMDGYNRTKMLGELSVYDDGQGNRGCINSWLLPDFLTIIGKDNGTEVFNQTFPVPNTPDVNYWPLILAGASLFSAHYNSTTTTDSNGCTTTTTDWGVDFGGSAPIQVPDGNSFVGDYVGFRFEREYPEGTDLSILAPITRVEITGCDLGTIGITSETYSH